EGVEDAPKNAWPLGGHLGLGSSLTDEGTEIPAVRRVAHDHPELLELFSTLYASLTLYGAWKGPLQKTFSHPMNEKFSCDAVKFGSPTEGETERIAGRCPSGRASHFGRRAIIPSREGDWGLSLDHKYSLQ